MGGAIDPAKLDKILSKFRRSSTNEGTSGTTTPVQVVDPLQSKYKLWAEFMAKPSKYDDLNDIQILMFKPAEKTDWKDLEPGRRTVFKFRYLDDHDLVQLGEKVFDSLKIEEIDVAESVVPNLMLLAYNLKDELGVRCFGEVPAELEDPENTKEFDAIVHLHPVKRYNERMANGFCYLAASYMSLYTISVEKYMKIQTRLQTKFINFYGFSFPFASFHLPFESVKAVKSHLDWNSILKNSFYNFLYAGELTPVGKDLKDFLYVIHISHTGLHPYTLFCQIMEALNVTNEYLGTIMHSKTVDRELNSLAGVFANLKGNQHSDYQYQMWRFGRIFDQTFLSSLQAKDAAFFIAVCANMLNILSDGSNEGILSIARIGNMHELMKKKARAYAVRILEIHLVKQTEAGTVSH